MAGPTIIPWVDQLAIDREDSKQALSADKVEHIIHDADGTISEPRPQP